MPWRVTFLSSFLPLLADQDAAIYMDLKLSGQLMQYDVHAFGVVETESVSPLLFNWLSNT
jgi:hypothetical protein